MPPNRNANDFYGQQHTVDHRMATNQDVWHSGTYSNLYGINSNHVSYSPSNKQPGNDSSYYWNNKNVNFSNPGYEDGSWNANSHGSQENGREVLQTHTSLSDATYQSGGE